jgi:hypothetical protein
MTMQSLGSIDPLLTTAYSGFDYPSYGTVVPVLSGDPTSGGNAVLQSSALTLRQAAVTVNAEDADALVLRGYYEAKTEVLFSDFDGTESTVVVMDFSRSNIKDTLWECSMTLLEMTPPVIGGS